MENNDDFFSLSLDDSLPCNLLLEESLEILLEGEFAALFKVDMLGLPDPLVEGCFGELFGLHIPMLCFGLLDTCIGECFGL